MKGKILTMALAGSLLYLCSCSDASKYDALVQPQPGDEHEQLSDEVEVTFTIAPESAGTISRAVGDQQTISKGKNIDILIFAVYDDDYTLLKQYGSNDTITNHQGLVSTYWNLFYMVDNNGKNLHDGQGVRYVGNVFPDGSEKITLRLMRGQTYHIAFWAQSSSTEVFNTSDLEKVTVDYNNAKNNEEFRDAFCKVETFTVTSVTETREITLTRPFAQINVGTDENNFNKHLTYGLEEKEGQAYTHYSKIVLQGVANTIDVVKDKIGDATDEEITFDYAEIPWTKYKHSDGNAENLIIKTPATDNDGDKDNPNIKTNYYVYMSMCYALVPASDIDIPSYEPDFQLKPTGGSVLNNVKFYFSNQQNGGTDEKKIFDIKSVPVHRNWRTNIIGGIFPNYEDEPHRASISVTMDPKYYDDNNEFYDRESEKK